MFRYLRVNVLAIQHADTQFLTLPKTTPYLWTPLTLFNP